ncbi:origin recognition complex subunit 3 N-terminus-domain-containing protein [Aspergillus granulosus]|uniref:Origin recognition complex subunit 3 N-terminus-domain-containing protein n=1 Tax=Aspergillus granulosus TaxID=176169 RepID=A0ABR4HH48_9EURO
METGLGVPSESFSINQGVYIYRPADAGKAPGERPSKRRKVAQEPKETDNDISPFVPLLNGDEPEQSVRLRYQTYEQLWSIQEAKIQEILDDVDAEVLENVSSFVKTASPEIYGGCIPAALLTVGSNVSSLARLLSRLNDQLTSTGEGGVIVLESGDAPNLKTTLKNIIRAAIINTEGNDGYQSFLTDREGPRLLGYDLDLLGEYVTQRRVKHLVLAFRDSEAFDPGILTDLFFLLSSWLDRIPLTLLFGISTSVELFEARLPRSSIALLKGRFFELHEASNCVDHIYERIQSEGGKFWLGRNLTGVLFEKSSDYFQTPESFCRTVKYAYMSHFFANPASVLLADEIPTAIQQDKLCEAIRNVPSFRKYCEALVEDGQTQQVRDLLEDDKDLFAQVIQLIKAGQQSMHDIFQTVKFISLLLKDLNITKKASMSELSIRALSGELQDSQTLEDTLAALKRLDSARIEALIPHFPDSMTNVPEFQSMRNDLAALLQVHSGPEPLRSEYDSQNSVIGTTIVQQRVKLNKSRANLPEISVKYTKIIDRVHALLASYFETTLRKPQDLPLHEAFLFDARNPIKEAFAPRPRFAIERALSNPFDYLMYTSETSEGKISSKQPATSILYQLYLESGALVNIHDLWQAFHAVFESEMGDNHDERMTMALFYRAMSELRALGMLKHSRKKIDHAAKSAWMGL